MRQNQVIAITNGKKTQTEKEITKIYQNLSKVDLFSGLDRTYRSIDDDGIQKPSEKKLVQNTVFKSIGEFMKPMSDMLNFVSTMDVGNCSAKANVIIDGTVILKDVPATHIIFLEKQVLNILNFVSSLPVLDPSEEWNWNSNVSCYSSTPRESSSTAKTLQFKVLYEATKEHPAQVEKYGIDEIVGYWTTIHFSGNVTADARTLLIDKVRKLQVALKMAREEANNVEVVLQTTGNTILDYIFKK